MIIFNSSLVGRKVICVDQEFDIRVHEWTDVLPKLRDIYTIRMVGDTTGQNLAQGDGIRLEELETFEDQLWFDWRHFELIGDHSDKDDPDYLAGMLDRSLQLQPQVHELQPMTTEEIIKQVHRLAKSKEERWAREESQIHEHFRGWFELLLIGDAYPLKEFDAVEIVAELRQLQKNPEQICPEKLVEWILASNFFGSRDSNMLRNALESAEKNRRFSSKSGAGRRLLHINRRLIAHAIAARVLRSDH